MTLMEPKAPSRTGEGYHVTDDTVQLDLPGAWVDEFFSGTSVAEDDEGGNPILTKAYKEAKTIKVGRGYSIRLTLPRAQTRNALDSLSNYVEISLAAAEGNRQDADSRQKALLYKEMRAAKKLGDRINNVLAWLDADRVYYLVQPSANDLTGKPWPFVVRVDASIVQPDGGRDFWPVRLIGFSRRLDEQKIDLHTDEFFADPQKALNMYVITQDSKGKWSTHLSAIESIERKEAAAD